MTQQDTPAISVLMPVYNAGRYLSVAVESILRQSYGDFEFIIINDGSDDGSLEILNRYADSDARILLVSRENKGLVKSLNEGLSIARAPFIARMDADDISLPNRFEKQVAFLETNPQTVCVGGAFRMIDEKGRFLTTLIPPLSDDDIQKLALSGHTTICHPCAMIRRNALLEVGGYRSEYYLTEDLDLWLRLGERGELANLVDPVINYRMHSQSISEKNNEKQKLAARRTCEDAWRRRGIAGVFDADDDWRPGEGVHSRLEFMLKYGWWAWNSRQRKTAAVYGLKAIQARPFSLDGWRLLACAAIKPFDSHTSGHSVR
jgi:glycosyltransferase involved in cell wall biosynthesis